MRNKLWLVLRDDEEDDGRKGKAVAGVNIDFPTWVKVTQIEYKTAGEPGLHFSPPPQLAEISIAYWEWTCNKLQSPGDICCILISCQYWYDVKSTKSKQRIGGGEIANRFAHLQNWNAPSARNQVREGDGDWPTLWSICHFGKTSHA